MAEVAAAVGAASRTLTAVKESTDPPCRSERINISAWQRSGLPAKQLDLPVLWNARSTALLQGEACADPNAPEAEP